MGFHCIACNSDKSTSHAMKNAKAGDLIPIAYCQNCGLVQLRDVPNGLDIIMFYKSKYRVKNRKQKRPILQHVDRAVAQPISWLKKIAPFIRENSKLLDFASARGEFTYIASRMGIDASGIDPSSGFLSFGKNHCSINVEQKQVSQLQGTQLYQIVIMVQLSEHLSNPMKVIRKVHQILKLGELFTIEFSNIESKAISTFTRFFKAHICYFTSLSLIGLLKNNFSVEYIENKDVISLVCQKSNAKKFKRPREYNTSAVNIVKSRLKCKNLREYILNGGLFEIFKKIPGTIKERYISHGKDPKMILESFFIREDLANDNLK